MLSFAFISHAFLQMFRPHFSEYKRHKCDRKKGVSSFKRNVSEGLDGTSGGDFSDGKLNKMYSSTHRHPYTILQGK